MHRTLRIVGALALGLALVACGSSEPKEQAGAIPQVTLNGDQEPTISKPSGVPPTTLVSKDLVVGTGAEAVATSAVTVNYTGMSWSTGETFDSSWQRGEPITFPLGNLILGWQQGIPGMKVGGKRLLVIPPDLGYGPSGQGSIKPNETLVFVIELKGVQ